MARRSMGRSTGRPGEEPAYLGLGARTSWRTDPELPVSDWIGMPMSVTELWQRFADVRAWPTWNPCMWTATVTGGPSLAEGAVPAAGRLLVWAFNPIRRRYLYRLPAIATLVEVVPEQRMTWEVRLLPGMWARHTYWMEPLEDGGCRFGSWEVAEGPVYRLLRTFWLAHFRYVCRQSLIGAGRLAAPRRRRSAR
jgi:hypothetical protein